MTKKEINNILQAKFGISKLNDMQEELIHAAKSSANDIVLLAPTGSGKTIAYLAGTTDYITPGASHIQLLVIAPSRELVIQITSVARKLYTSAKITECYGGHKVEDEQNSISAGTDIIIGTPGRILDHLNRKTLNLNRCKAIILDEFDKILELGFEDELKRIFKQVNKKARLFLTSATEIAVYPDFIQLNNPQKITNRADTKNSGTLTVYKIDSPSKDKLVTLEHTLNCISQNERVIVFVNYRDAALRVYEYLIQQNYPAGVYIGSMNQIEREKAIEMFNNGSIMILVCTDLASRGLDIQSIGSVIHYHMPINAEAYTHRNGRTARQDATGTAFVIIGPDEILPEYMDDAILYTTDDKTCNCKIHATHKTIYFNAGRKEKISKGDIVGFLVNKGGIDASQIGVINIHDHYALVAIAANAEPSLLKRIKGEKIKNKKILISSARQNIEES